MARMEGSLSWLLRSARKESSTSGDSYVNKARLSAGREIERERKCV